MKNQITKQSKKRNQQGQAVTECLVLAVAVVPLFLLIPYIAKYQDVAHQTQLASRYVAFEATQRNEVMGGGFKPEAQLADEVRQRFFGRPDSPIQNGLVAQDVDAQQNRFWRDPQGRALVERFDDVTVSFGAASGPTHGDAIVDSDGADVLNTPGALAGLKAKGIYRANVSVKLLNLPAGIQSLEPFDNINLAITRSTSVMFDPWAAQSVSQTNSRVNKLLPLDSALQIANIEVPLRAAIDVIDFGVLGELGLDRTFTLKGSVKAPKFGRLERWEDLVPADRLSATP
jgi:hypothetical protein